MNKPWRKRDGKGVHRQRQSVIGELRKWSSGYMACCNGSKRSCVHVHRRHVHQETVASIYDPGAPTSRWNEETEESPKDSSVSSFHLEVGAPGS